MDAWICDKCGCVRKWDVPHFEVTYNWVKKGVVSRTMITQASKSFQLCENCAEKAITKLSGGRAGGECR